MSILFPYLLIIQVVYLMRIVIIITIIIKEGNGLGNARIEMIKIR